MKIIIYCASVVHNINQATQMAGCGIVLIAEEGEQTIKKSMSFGLGGSDTELANIQVIRLALSSIAPRFRNIPIQLHINNVAAADLLIKNGDDYKIVEPKYKQQSSDMRRLVCCCSNISVIWNDSDTMMVEAIELATTACISQS